MMALRLGSYASITVGSAWSDGQVLTADDLSTTINSVVPKYVGSITVSYSGASSGNSYGSIIVGSQYTPRGVLVQGTVRGQGNTSGGNPANTSNGYAYVVVDTINSLGSRTGSPTTIMYTASNTNGAVNNYLYDNNENIGCGMYYLTSSQLGSSIMIVGSAVVGTSGETGTAVVDVKVYYYG